MRLWIDAKTCSNRVGALPADPQLAERSVAKGVAERRAALVEDLLAVGDEEQPVARERRSEARVVDRRHDRLARAGRGDEQVAVVAMVARELDLLEQALLERSQLELDRAEQMQVATPVGTRCPLARTRSASYGTKSPLAQ